MKKSIFEKRREEFDSLFKNWDGKGYNTKQLQFFEKLLKEKKEVAQRDIEVLRSTMGSPEELTGDDKIRQIADNEVILRKIGRLSKHIKNLDRAIYRIHVGMYGRCSVSGKMIPPKRLFASPYTSVRVEYQSK